MITVSPATVCINASNSVIRVHQCQSDWYLTLQPGQTEPLIWFNPEAKQELMVRPISRDMVWNWSGRFTVAEVANHMLRVHARDDCAHYAILPITIMMQVCVSEFNDGSWLRCTATTTLLAGILHGVHNWSSKFSAGTISHPKFVYQPCNLRSAEGVCRMAERQVFLPNHATQSTIAICLG